jgi:uncharacterized protein (TIGR00730 family)
MEPGHPKHPFKFIRSVTFFGYSESKPGNPVYEAAKEVAYRCAQHGLTVVAGGFGGEMEAAAEGAAKAKGKSIGVTFYPRIASKFEGTKHNKYLTEEVRTSTYLERTLKLIALGDAFVVFNGGTGTYGEMALAWSLARIYFGHHKPLVLVGKFWNEIIDVVKQNMYLRPEEMNEGDLKIYRIVENPDEVMKALHLFDEEMEHAPHLHYQALVAEEPFIK